MHTFFRRNGLSLVLISIMMLTWCGQAVMGWHQDNDERGEHHLPPIAFHSYLATDHFWSATAENWESEFLQMGLYVLLTIKLRQKGSSESKPMEGEQEVDREPVARPGAPWAVRKGGWVLAIYKHSLSIAFILLFLISFTVHLLTSCGDYNAQQAAKGLPGMGVGEYLGGSRFWFQSLQNWQSEFLAVFAIVFLSIYLRQKGSPESKPVDAPDGETGE